MAGASIIATCLITSGVSLTPHGAAATTFFLGLTYIAGGIGIGGGLLEFYSGSSGNALDGKTLSKEEAEYRKKNGLESAIISALNMIGTKILSEINKQNQTNINNSKNEGASGAKIGEVLGKNGKLVENPQTKIDWSKTSTHGIDRMTERGVTREMAESWKRNGKALEQSSGDKHLFFTSEGAVVVATDGTVVTTIPRSYYDAGYLELSKKLFGK